MSLLHSILAQAAVPEEVTPGKLLGAAMFLATAIGSLVMIVVWVLRFLQSGHALPAARRGVLRVPIGLTIVAIVLSCLFMILVFSMLFVDPDPVVNDLAVGGPQAIEIPSATVGGEKANDEKADTAKSEGVVSQTESAEKPADSTDNQNATKDEKPPLDHERMQNGLVQTIALDLVMLLSFGVVILVASRAGRVYLTEYRTRPRQATGRSVSSFGSSAGAVTPVRTYGSPWPDLDDASAIPQMPGYDILGAQPGPKSPPAVLETESNPSATALQPSDAVEPNPYAMPLPNEQFGDDQNADSTNEGETRPPDEKFSFTHELRFAGEVFLAAYIPTTALRLLIVMISYGISGKTPPSHPFLEMLDQGVSIAMIALILVMAVFVAPIVEELQFRVVVLGGLAQSGWPKAALIVSSILFAFAHQFPDSIALIPLAVALGYTYLRRRSYVTVMLVHFLFNGFNMILALVAMF